MNRRIIQGTMLCSLVVALPCAAQERPTDLVISDVTVVSAERTEPLENAYVRILDGEIAAVSVQPLAGEEEIDGSGRYLIPGLIDTHVHLVVSPGWPAFMTQEQAAENPDIVSIALDQDPRSYLYFGFTTVLDLISTSERTAQWNALELRPDAHFCGGAWVVEGAYRLGLAPTFSYDEGSRLDPREYSPEDAVERIAADGATCVKTVYDAVYLQTLAQAQALVEAAHANDLPVFIHANREAGQSFAVAAGVDVIAHGMWRGFDEEAALNDEARHVLAAIARDRIGYQPTTQVMVGLIDMLDDNYMERAELVDSYPRIVIDWLEREMAGRYGEQMRNAGIDSDLVLTFRRETVERATDVKRILADADARLLFGSDTPSDAIFTNPPGLNGRLEMDNWIAAGVSEEMLFRAMTIDNAQALGLESQIGTIESGKTANLLLLNANPLESVDAYDSIEIVFLHGRPILRETMSARNATPR